MYARSVTMHLKANRGPEFTSRVQRDVLPVLRKQEGFKDEITFVDADLNEAVAISLWERKEDADAYGRDAYPDVLKSLDRVVDGTPELIAYEVSNSTFHNIAAASR